MTGRDKLALIIGALTLLCFGLTKKKKTNTATDKTALRVLYFQNALQYHVAARYAAFSGFIPVCGSLFHHAIELYLKGYFCQTMGEGERRQMGHNLKKIWRRYKKDVSDASLDRFDSVISALDRHEAIRYPDKAAERGMTGYITFAKGSVAKGVEPDKKSLPYFEVQVDELDALAREIITRAKVNPQFFVAGFNPFAQDFLNRENKSPL